MGIDREVGATNTDTSTEMYFPQSTVNTILSATIAIVSIGNFQMEGLRSENGDFGIAVPQLIAQNLINNSNSTYEVKALLGEGSNLIIQWKTSIAKRPVNVVLLKDFHRLLVKLTAKGNEKAEQILESLSSLSLHQLFADAFEINATPADRQALLKSNQDDWEKARSKGIQSRRAATDHVATFKPTPKDYAITTNSTYLGLFGKKAAEIKEERGVPKKKSARDAMTNTELIALSLAEALVAEREHRSLEELKRDSFAQAQAISKALSR